MTVFGVDGQRGQPFAHQPLALSLIVVTLLAELHGRMGYSPAVLCLNWGSGHEAVTVAYALRDARMARSRCLTDGGHPLGWAQLTILEEG